MILVSFRLVMGLFLFCCDYVLLRGKGEGGVWCDGVDSVVN